MTQSIPIGPPVIITQNVIYALPSKPVVVTSSASLEVSNSQSGPWTSLSSGAATSSAFVRCTSASPTVTCKDASKVITSGGASDPLVLQNYLAVGANPAQSGSIRIEAEKYIKSRDTAGTADVNLIGFIAGGHEVGQPGKSLGLVGSSINVDNGSISVGSGQNISCNRYYMNRLGSPPSAPDSTHGILFCQLVGGKTQLAVLFGTGAVQVIASEP